MLKMQENSLSLNISSQEFTHLMQICDKTDNIELHIYSYSFSYSFDVEGEKVGLVEPRGI